MAPLYGFRCSNAEIRWLILRRHENLLTFGIAKMQIIFYNRIAKKKCRMTVLWAVILFCSALWQLF